jgi:cytochrome b involved in lipid metabolism
MTSPAGRDASTSFDDIGLCQQASKSLKKRQLEQFNAPSGDAATTSDDAATESGKNASEFWQVVVARLFLIR